MRQNANGLDNKLSCYTTLAKHYFLFVHFTQATGYVCAIYTNKWH